MGNQDQLGFNADFIDPRIGATVAGRYLVLRPLGSGGMGQVYEARHQVVGNRVALKILHPHLAQHTEYVERFLAEARAAGNIGHPNIVTCVDAGRTDEGIPFLALEFLEGQTLLDMVRNESPLPLPRILHIASQIAAGLGAAHEQGIIHRDIKPENILLTRSPEGIELVKILDFGIAKFTRDHTTMTDDGRVLGSPLYMAPEQMVGSNKVDERADIYSLAVLIADMLKGDRSLPGASLPDLIRRTERGERVIPSVAALREGLPPGLIAILERNLSIERGDRQSSILDFRDSITTLDQKAPLDQAAPMNHGDSVNQATPGSPTANITAGVAERVALLGTIALLALLIGTWITWTRDPRAANSGPRAIPPSAGAAAGTNGMVPDLSDEPANETAVPGDPSAPVGEPPLERDLEPDREDDPLAAAPRPEPIHGDSTKGPHRGRTKRRPTPRETTTNPTSTVTRDGIPIFTKPK
ncbi:MAG: serine/threonine protein kinase [Myxococcales bacterium]|nr:serine/threonine protein kinase [Myxococcales bacterium]